MSQQSKNNRFKMFKNSVSDFIFKPENKDARSVVIGLALAGVVAAFANNEPEKQSRAIDMNSEPNTSMNIVLPPLTPSQP